MAATRSSPITSATSPNLEQVRRFIEAALESGETAEMVDAIIDLVARMCELNAELMRKLVSHTRARPPSETLRRLQLELPLLIGSAANDSAGANSGTTPPPSPDPAKNKTRKKRGPNSRHRHARPILPAHLPRVAQPHLVTGAERICPCCHVEAKHVRFKTCEKLELKPAEFFVLAVKREMVACPKCHAYVRVAARPDEVIDRGLLGDELLIQSLVDHYDNAVPFERMANSAAQHNVPLCAVTLARGVGRLVDLYDAVVKRLRRRCLASAFTALDATRMPVIDPHHPLGIRSGSLWLIEGDHRYACFFFAPTGHDRHLKEILEGHALGSVMCDGSATNNCVEQRGATRGGCNGHARRKLVEALRTGDARAVEGIRLFAEIFHVDAESARAGETLEQRAQRRARDAAPLVDKLRDWLTAQRAQVEPKTPLGKALGYMHRQWRRLTAFLSDPRMELSNNEVERDFRRWVLARKTWMFVGNEQSAKRAADALTLITTCKKLGVEPRSYLRTTLALLLAGEKDIVKLMPDYYAFASPDTGAAAA